MKITSGAVAASLVIFIASATAQQIDEQKPGRPGSGVDSRGGPVIDPTENVKALSEAANKRQDDLRAASEKFLQAQLESAEKVNQQRYDGLRELSASQDRRIDEISKLRAEYNERLAVAEAKRIDAIRAVDVNAVAVASTRATDQATVLASQVSQSAEALRALVAATATTVAASQQQLANTLSARLTTLEQGSYQQAGKQIVQDPAYAQLLRQVDLLTQTRAQVSGAGEGQSALIAGAIAFISILIALGSLILNFSRRPSQHDERRA